MPDLQRRTHELDCNGATQPAFFWSAAARRRFSSGRGSGRGVPLLLRALCALLSVSSALSLFCLSVFLSFCLSVFLFLSFSLSLFLFSVPSVLNLSLRLYCANAARSK